MELIKTGTIFFPKWFMMQYKKDAGFSALKRYKPDPLIAWNSVIKLLLVVTLKAFCHVI